MITNPETIQMNINMFCEENGNNLTKIFKNVWNNFYVKLGIIKVLIYK